MSGASALALASFLFEHGVYMDLDAAMKLTRLSKNDIKQAAKDGRVAKWPGRKLRYRTMPVACSLEGEEIRLAEPVDGAAPGQTAVFLAGDLVVGTATIA